MDEDGNVVFSMGLTDADGEDVMTVVCASCSAVIEEGSDRWHCLECKRLDVCMDCKERHGFHSEHMGAVEKWHPIWLHLDVRGQDMAQTAHNLLVTYRNRPALSDISRVGPAEEPELHWVTYGELHRRALALACRLEAHLKPRSFVGLMAAHNSVAWYTGDLALTLARFVSVGMQATLDSASLIHIVNTAQLSAVFVASDCVPAWLDGPLLASCPSVQLLIIMDGHPAREEVVVEGRTVRILSQLALTAADELSAEPVLSSGLCFDSPVDSTSPPPPSKAKEAGEEEAKSDRDQLFTLIFTSGSSGRPKGVMISQAAFVGDVDRAEYRSPFVCLSFLPSALASDRLYVWLALSNGGRVAFSKGGLQLYEDMQLVNPTTWFAPPAVFTLLHDEYNREHAAASSAEEQAALLPKYRGMLGNRLQSLATGGAPVGDVVVAWCRAVLCDEMHVGYGATETGGITVDNHLSASVDAQLRDIPEMGYLISDRPYPRGEICVKTEGLTLGYYGDAEATAKAFTEDGYYRTGDVGMREPGGRIVIIDRIKHCFKLSISEFISPAKIETVLEGACSVAQLFVYGSSEQAFVCGVVVPNWRLLPWSPEDEHVLDNADLHHRILSELRAVGRAHGLRAFEIPRGLLLEAEPWTAANGLLTPSMKLRRIPLRKKYGDRLRELYAQLTAAATHSGASGKEEGKADDKSDDSVAAVLLNMVADLVGTVASEVDLHSSFQDNGGSSLASVAFVSRISARWHFSTAPPLQFFVSTPLVVVAEAISAGMPATIVHGWLHGRLAQLRGELDADACLPEDITMPTDDAIACEGGALLLTGATGFIGRHLLMELVEHDERHVFALVRARSHEAAMEKLKLRLEEAALDSAALAGRVTVWAADLTQASLGLSEAELAMVKLRVEAVVHLAAAVTFDGTYSSLRAANVHSSLQLLRLCCSSTPAKHMHYASTLSVFGSLSPAWDARYRGGHPRAGESIALSEESSIGSSAFDSGVLGADGYAQSKWVCEQLMTAARAAGLPVTVHRIGFTSWHSRSGFSNCSDWLTRLLLSVAQLARAPATPEPGAVLNLSPVDYVASVMRQLVQLPAGEQAAVYHVMNPTGYTAFARLIAMLRRSGMSAASADYREWMKLVQLKGDGVPAFGLLPFLQTGFPQGIHYSAEALAASLPHVKTPAIEQDSVARWAAFLLKHAPAAAAAGPGHGGDAAVVPV
eukprot:PLAT11072.1.p1 GENE.PLAT11072.1~~PLAT11072.1.p1  ORF type:complete len:1238 (-),score=422.06 PLAT11072.1:44-3667(-)